MLFKKITFSLFTFLLFISFAEAQTRMNMDSLGRWDDNSLVATGSQNAYNDIWGYADANGNEFAIFGTREFIIVVDVTNPASPVEVGRIAGGGNSTWRDVKTYGTYAYAVTDNNGANEGLMIIDLSNLPTSISLATQTNSFFNDCHNLFIDEPNHTMYAAGTDTRFNGLMVFDLQADPENPTQLADVALSGAGYVHDLYVRGDTAYCNHGNNGLRIWDFSTPTSPVNMGSLTTYPESGYNHSNWITDNGDYMVFCDETHDTGVKIMDITNFGSLSVPSNQVFRSELLAPGATGSIAHNPIIKGDTLYISYYHDGVQVFDISTPSNVTRIAYFDTEPTNTNYNGYEGPWGMYPLLPSGNIIASDQLNGLYIMRVVPENDFTIDVSPGSQSVCPSQNADYTINLTPAGIFSDDVTLSVNNLPSGATASFSSNPVSLPPAGTSTLTVSNLSGVSAGTYNLDIVGTSPGKTHTRTVSLTVLSVTPAQVNLSLPANGATNTSRLPAFEWASTGSGDSYEIEVASDQNFNNVVLTQSGITGTTHSFSTSLNSNTTYYWHVRASNNCGTGTYSSNYSFTTSNNVCTVYPAANVPVTIPNTASTVTSVLDLTIPGTVADLNLKDLDISHTWVSDLKITLRGPDGTEVVVVDQICREEDDFFLTFDDEASNNYGSIPCPPVGGASYQPANPLSAFDGKIISGPWVLRVEDLANQDGGSIDGWGLEICQATPPPACAAPSGFAVTNLRNDRATVSWQAVSGAIKYNLNYRPVGGNWISKATTTLSRNLSGLASGTVYEYRARTDCGSGYDSWSAIETFTTSDCGSPTNITVTNIEGTKVDLSWSVEPNTSLYKINYRPLGTSNWNGKNANTPNKTLNSLTPGTTYEYRLRSNCPYGWSAWSAIQTFTTDACGFPTGSNITNASPTEVTVNWATVSNASRYKISYRPLGTNSWTTTNNTPTSITLNSLTPDTDYQYRMRSDCPFGWSSWSPLQNFTTPPVTLQNPNVTSRNNASTIGQAELFPNPVSEVLSVVFESTDEANMPNLTIMDLTGRIVKKDIEVTPFSGMGEVQVNVRDLPTGTYILNITSRTGNQNSKFVKF